MLGRKAPQIVGDLNDNQLERWREGDDSVWNEDSKGRPLSARAIARRDAREREAERELEAGQ